jgi:hypothetical protein
MRYLFQILLTVMVVTGSSVSEAKDLYYCPMHPSYQSDKPGSCPICHMSLVKKAVAADPNQNKGAKAVHLNEHQQELLGIATVPVKMMPLKKIIRTGGYVNTMHDIFNTQDEYIKAYTNYVNAFRDQKRFAHTRRNWAANREVQLNLHAAEDKLLRLGLNHDEIQKLQKFSWRTPWQEAGLSFFNEDQHYWVTAQFYEQDLGYLLLDKMSVLKYQPIMKPCQERLKPLVKY